MLLSVMVSQKVPDGHCEARGAVAIPWEIPRVVRLPRFARNDKSAFLGLFTSYSSVIVQDSVSASCRCSRH